MISNIKILSDYSDALTKKLIEKMSSKLSELSENSIVRYKNCTEASRMKYFEQFSFNILRKCLICRTSFCVSVSLVNLNQSCFLLNIYFFFVRITTIV